MQSCTMDTAGQPDLCIESRLDGLPNEILENIMGHCEGILALYSLVSAHHHVKALFERRPQTMMLQAIRQSGMDAQLQQIFCTIISIRQRQRYNAKDVSFRTYIANRLKSQSAIADLDLGLLPTSKSIHVLSDAAEVYKSIAEAEESFVSVTLPRIAANVQSHFPKDPRHQTLQNPCPTDLTRSCEPRRPSATELYRIRRALWRLRLYFEAYFEPYIVPMYDDRGEATFFATNAPTQRSKASSLFHPWARPEISDCLHRDSQSAFFNSMRCWELEELECVWHHLAYYADLWRRPCPNCLRSYLPDDLLAHLQICEGDEKSRKAHYSYEANFARACRIFRLNLRGGVYGSTTEADLASWSDAPARESNDGFKFLKEHNLARRARGLTPSQCYIMYPVYDFLEWGYCMWDRKRLDAWGLVNSIDGRTKAVLKYWKHSESRGGQRRSTAKFADSPSGSKDFA